MPQFDSVTFLPQIFWLTLVFFAFYMVVIRDYLPGLTRIVKIRKKRLEAAQKTGSAFAIETIDTTSSYEDLLVKSADSTRQVAGNTVQSGSDWIESSIDSLDHNDITELNKGYAEANGTIKSKHYIIQQLIKG